MFFSYRSRHRAKVIAISAVVVVAGFAAWYWFGTDRTGNPLRFALAAVFGLLLCAVIEYVSTATLGVVANRWLKLVVAFALIAGTLAAVAFVSLRMPA